MTKELRAIHSPGTPTQSALVGLTTSALIEESARTLLVRREADHSSSAGWIVLLGDAVRDPIARLWSRLPAELASVLPCAWDRVLVCLPESEAMPHMDDLANVVISRGLQVDATTVLQPPQPVEDYLPLLAPQSARPSAWLRSAMRLAVGKLDGITSPPDRTAVEAGLLLMHDCLDESHQHSQSIEGKGRHAAGDYWHAIMHRREPDAGNSKYWFRRVGRHPIFQELASIASRLAAEMCELPQQDRLRLADLVHASAWDPFLFIDLCDASRREEDAPLSRLLRAIQAWEMALLLEQTVQDARS